MENNHINSNYTNTFFNDYFLNDKNYCGKTNKITRISDNIVNLNPIPLYLNPVILHHRKVNTEIKEILQTIDKNIDIKYYNYKETEHAGFFTTQDAAVTNIDIMTYENDCIVLLKSYLRDGMKELLSNVYNYNGVFNMEILMSNIHSYSDGVFINPHTHINYTNNKANNLIKYSAAYYVDDGDPDKEIPQSGCVSFISNDRPYHIRPKAGTLLIWESDLSHYVCPFYSKSNKERIVITINFFVELIS